MRANPPAAATSNRVLVACCGVLTILLSAALWLSAGGTASGLLLSGRTALIVWVVLTLAAIASLWVLAPRLGRRSAPARPTTCSTPAESAVERPLHPAA